MSDDSLQVRDRAARYFAETHAQDVPHGYKRTEVGVIPEDWDIKPLADVCTPQGIVRGPFGGALKKEVFVGRGFKVYEQRNAIYKTCEIGSYFVDETKYAEMHRFSISPGDFIVSCSGTIGRIYQLPRNAPPGVINQALLKLTVSAAIIEDRYFYILFEWGNFQAKITDSTQGGAMKNLVGMDVFKTTPVVVPPAHEQRAIAEALSDVDDLLAGLEALIAKKQAIKQAAMQQLLTGNTRLPGFSGPWETKRLGEHVAYLRTGTNSRAELIGEGSTKYIHYGDIHTSTQVWLNPTVHDIPSLPEERARTLDRLRDGDLVFVDASEDLDGVGKSVEVTGASNAELVSGLHTIAARFDKSVLADSFKAFLQFCPAFRQHLRRLAAGTKVYATNRGHISSAEVPLPSVEEQTAIATVLSDIDIEIAALERRRDKTRAIKQGMMQQLLTGRVRLVNPEVAA